MRTLLKKFIKKASSIEEVLQVTLAIISQVKKDNPETRIGYVAGKVTTDGKKTS